MAYKNFTFYCLNSAASSSNENQKMYFNFKNKILFVKKTFSTIPTKSHFATYIHEICMGKVAQMFLCLSTSHGNQGYYRTEIHIAL